MIEKHIFYIHKDEDTVREPLRKNNARYKYLRTCEYLHYT